MANPAHLAQLEKDIETWQKWRKKNPESVFTECKREKFVGADFARANLEGVNLEGVNLEGANLEGANLEGANLEWANLEGANLERANLEGASLVGTDLKRANLIGANLKKADLKRANLIGAHLMGAKLDKANIQTAFLIKANLETADLEAADLKGASLQKANLRGANLKAAILFRTNLRGTNLNRANLQGTNFREAELMTAHLVKANLEKANLERADFQGANLQGADLRKAVLAKTIFSSAQDLERLCFPLSSEQLAGCMFKEEANFYDRFEKEESLAPQRVGEYPIPRMVVHYTDKTPWTPYEMVLFFGAIHDIYNKIMYLLTTEDKDQETLVKNLLNPTRTRPLPQNNLAVTNVDYGSMTTEFVNAYTLLKDYVPGTVKATTALFLTSYAVKVITQAIIKIAAAIKSTNEARASKYAQAQAKANLRKTEVEIRNAELEGDLLNQKVMSNNLKASAVALSEEQNLLATVRAEHAKEELVHNSNGYKTMVKYVTEHASNPIVAKNADTIVSQTLDRGVQIFSTLSTNRKELVEIQTFNFLEKITDENDKKN
nr:pentapeptide repeat-containing protein [uncultured Pseudodesulfovibrio sp.]